MENAFFYGDQTEKLPTTVSNLVIKYIGTFEENIPEHVISLKANNIKYLPTQLKHLEIESIYFLEKPFSLSPSITSLVITAALEKKIEFFPPHLISLKLYYSEIKLLPSLPPSLRSLEMIRPFGDLNSLQLPRSLLHFTIYATHEVNGFLSFPPFLKSLFITGDINHGPFPSSLLSLTYLNHANYEINTESLPLLRHLNTFKLNQNLMKNLPSSLTELSLHEFFDKALLPSSLKKLDISLALYSLPPLPPNITHLKIGEEFNHNIDSLPPSLKILSIGDSFNQPINSLPPSLTSLTLGDKFNHPVDNLPLSLIYLSLGMAFSQPVNNLPRHLSSLELKGKCSQSLNNLPHEINLKIGSGSQFWKSPPPPCIHSLTYQEITYRPHFVSFYIFIYHYLYYYY